MTELIAKSLFSFLINPKEKLFRGNFFWVLPINQPYKSASELKDQGYKITLGVSIVF